MKQGTFGINQGTFGLSQGTVGAIQGTFGMDRGIFGIKQGTFDRNQGTMRWMEWLPQVSPLHHVKQLDHLLLRMVLELLGFLG
jgi:hypothetical protein